MTPDFTLNYGLRWEINQPPFNHTGTALFPDDANISGRRRRSSSPGELNGVQNPVIAPRQEGRRRPTGSTSRRASASRGRRTSSDGLLATIFGTGDETVFRGGYDVTYFDEGTNMFASTAGNNPGQSQGLLLSRARRASRPAG